MDKLHRQPWGLTRSAPFAPTGAPPVAPFRVELDPVSQTGIYRDVTSGQIIEAGKHGTNKQTSMPTATSGGDGAKDGGKDNDSSIDYADD